jgi:hypothetical protein
LWVAAAVHAAAAQDRATGHHAVCLLDRLLRGERRIPEQLGSILRFLDRVVVER